jgi:hypothetical protein
VAAILDAMDFALADIFVIKVLTYVAQLAATYVLAALVADQLFNSSVMQVASNGHL